MAKKISMQDIAKKLGLSKNTVSLTMRGMPGISRETRELILDTAKKMGYVYTGSSASSSKAVSSSRNICLIMTRDIKNATGFYSYIQLGVEDEARLNGMNTVIYYHDETAGAFETPRSIKEGMISGIVTLGHLTRQTLSGIVEMKLPVVVIDEYFDNIKMDYVLTDNLCGGYMAAEYLIACGHRKIGFSGEIRRSASFYDRYLGFLKAMDAHGLPVSHSAIQTTKPLMKLIMNGTAEVVEAVRSLYPLPTAFFCCNDSEALALYKAFEVMGIKVPDDVSIMGFDNSDAARTLSPELTTMHVEKELMGREAVKRLVKKMKQGEGIPRKLLISTRLVERNSVRKLV